MSTDAGGSETLTFGLDPDATDGVDSQLGESERPPVPPGGVFDARWIDDHIDDPSTFGEGLLVDIRPGSLSSNGTRQHEIQFQAGDGATEVTIEWNLPAGVTGTVEDRLGGDIYAADMEGSGSLTVARDDPEALLTIDYNEAPSLDVNEGITLDEGGQVDISTGLLSASDPDHDPPSLTFTVTDGPTEGELLVGGTAATTFTQQDLIDGVVAYDHTADIPPGDVPPDDAFTFDLSDSQGEGPTGNVFSVSVRPVNDPPTVANDANTTQQGTAISVSAPGLLENDSDPNGDPLSVSAVNGSASNVSQQITLASGALLSVESGGAYSYDPNGAFDDLGAGKTGADSFTYTASDGNGGTGQASVSLTIEGGNGAPTAAGDSFSAYEDSTLTVAAPGILGNDSDPDGDLLTPSVVSPPSNGTLTLSENGSLEYGPETEFTGTDSFVYEVTDGNGAADQATVTLEVSGTRMLSLEDGWNLVALPYQPEDQAFGSLLLPSCTSGFLYDSSSGNEPIEDGDSVPVGEGFWANCSSGTVQVTGQRVGSQEINVTAGWNIIGPFADSADAGTISSEPSGIITSSVYSFSQSEGYTSVSTLVPGNGHWVNVSQSGTLTFGGESATNSLSAGPRQQNVGENGETVSIQVTDSQGREATLRLRSGSPPAEKRGYELPPVPPRGTFDIRFANGASLATVEAGTGDASFQDVRLQGVEYPLTLRLQSASPSRGVNVRQSQGPDAEVATLSPSAPSVTLQDETGRLQVGLRDVPEQFSLRRSVPNPASEQSTITFSVPEQTRVEIALFDVLGRRVRTLADGEQTSGQHDVRLDVQSLSSGTYFYRMSADGFSETRRLQVVR